MKKGWKKTWPFKIITSIGLILLSTWLIFLLFPSNAHAVCARVKLEILQELTFERIAFDAMMKIHNESDIPLNNIRVDISLEDPDGEDVSSLFFVRVSSMNNIDAVDGTGTVPPYSTSEIHWLIIPSAGAGGEEPQGQVYFAGATLGYNMGGAQEVTEVVPDSIVVKPQPMLILDYFEPRFVYGDDPFTPETEPPIPYYLGVRVKNVGYGIAKNLVIDSGQPKIVENELGLLIDFRILGSEVNGHSATNSLLVNFGDIAPDTCGTARWEMISTLNGEFITFDVSFTHADELGGELTSLIQETNAHFLVHDVLMDLPGRDRIKDFLAFDGPDLLVFESDNLETEVEILSSQATLTGAPSSSNPDVSLDFLPVPGAVYVSVPDPTEGHIQLESVTRSDGKSLLPENFWISLERENHQWYAYVNIFDVNSTGSYTIRYLTGGLNDTDPPESYVVIEEPSFSQAPTFVNRSTEFLFLATDDLSGVNQILFKIDDSDYGPAINPFKFSQRPAYTDEYHTIYFYSIDNEGNQETPQSVDVYLDTQPPVIETFSAFPETIFPDAPPDVTWADRTLTIDYTLTDDIENINVTLEIIGAGALIWQIQDTVQSNTSTQTTWDGKDNEGNLAPPGTYHIRLTASDPLGQFIISDLIPIQVQTYFNEKPLSPCEDCDQMYPDITGDIVVWQDNRNGDWDIYLYNLTLQTEQNLTPQSGDQTHPATDGLKVVWQDEREGTEDIYLYDLEGGQEQIIEDDTSSQINPAISGHWIVWQDNRYANWDIYAYNLDTQEKINLTGEETSDQINPSISGQIVAWEDYRHGLGEIYIYDLQTHEERRVTADEYNQTSPVVSEEKIAWVDQRFGNREIFIYDLVLETESQITNGTADSAQASLENGTLIYTDYTQGVEDPNPRFHILNTEHFLFLTNNPALQEEPDIFGNTAVWQDFRTERWQIYTVVINDYFPDADGDGIVDELDECPDTPQGEIVDSQGCPSSQIDTDNDGMADDWEMTHFNTLDRDGTGDFDLDGISDLDEYLNGTNPASSNVPTIPIIVSPEDAAEVTNLQPGLMIQNSTDPDGDAIIYEFEVYSDQEMTELVVSQSNVPEEIDYTVWTVSEEISDNTWYYWRVRATDGLCFSQWAYGSFFVNTENDPPGAFHISSPGDGSHVDTQLPVLEVINSEDPDGDVLTYEFDLYEDEAMGILVASASQIPAGGGGRTVWTVDTILNDNTTYYWKVIATDEHGDTAETLLSSFFVNTFNDAPTTPVISSPEVGTEVTSPDISLVVENASDLDGDFLDYYFEMDTVDSFDSQDLETSGAVTEGADHTTWEVSGLMDNTFYSWRVKASDGVAESGWTLGHFFMNTENDPPSIPVPRNPGQMAWVETLTPELELNTSMDVDLDLISYDFEVYLDTDTPSLVAQGSSGTTNWTVSPVLSDNTWYFWKANAVDEHGLASGWMEDYYFFTNDNGVDDPPTITVTEPSSNIPAGEESILIMWEDSDPDSNADITLYYDTDNMGEDGTLIIDGIKEDPEGDSDSYLWDVTGMTDGTYYVYATIADDTSLASDYSPGSVTIGACPLLPALALSSPANGAIDVSLTPTITWNSVSGALSYHLFVYDSSGTVVIDSPNLSTTYFNVPSGVLAEDSSYTWKVVAVDDCGFGEEPVPFGFTTISPAAPSITVLTPNGGEVLDGGTSFDITWDYTGDFGVNVKIEYNTGGRIWTTITSTAVCAERSYIWTVPSEESTSCRIRVTSIDDRSISDTSDADFEIR